MEPKYSVRVSTHDDGFIPYARMVDKTYRFDTIEEFHEILSKFSVLKIFWTNYNVWTAIVRNNTNDWPIPDNWPPDAHP